MSFSSDLFGILYSGVNKVWFDQRKLEIDETNFEMSPVSSWRA
ncbi:hypothetical protein SBF1_2770008 [Candidatus Desulfosporosinus infrequens]|uniref:Uncharacterized protein n=1 Tax=Candidatus Desulfosporosinus infrequens TaxID=2043169 RepID=A0A2U3KUB4_9FIRM|nr:hypothetical protein SBF1_2770008 [Candidatus Desulfosporosinus infrequens]